MKLMLGQGRSVAATIAVVMTTLTTLSADIIVAVSNAGSGKTRVQITGGILDLSAGPGFIEDNPFTQIADTWVMMGPTDELLLSDFDIQLGDDVDIHNFAGTSHANPFEGNLLVDPAGFAGLFPSSGDARGGSLLLNPSTGAAQVRLYRADGTPIQQSVTLNSIDTIIGAGFQQFRDPIGTSYQWSNSGAAGQNTIMLTVAVPEPSALLLTLMLGIVACFHRVRAH